MDRGQRARRARLGHRTRLHDRGGRRRILRLAVQLLWEQPRQAGQAAAPDLVARAIAPDYALGSHTASLGLAFGTLPALGEGAFVGQHGSWNRRPRSGYKVIFVPSAGGKPAGPPVDVLTGFLDANGHALGRPVGVATDARGGLLVADDVGGTVWRVGR